jgi:hypothetical protein
MTFPRRTSGKQREELWKAEAAKAVAAGRGEYPICKLCDLPIKPGSLWHENHEAHKPRWLGGVVDGISHGKCNRVWNNTHDTPLYAKNERIRKRHLDFTRSDNPLPGGREDRLKKKIDGRIVDRRWGHT